VRDLRRVRSAAGQHPSELRRTTEPLEALDPVIDHLRGGAAGQVILGYRDHECPYSGGAYREIERVEKHLGAGVRFALRHFPLTGIHPHALAAAGPAEAAALRVA
jgi:protein-disulfide isomerase